MDRITPVLTPGTLLGIWLLIINIVTYIVYGVDKWKAASGRWRIPERTLLLLAAVGGAAGALLGIFVWHHKTRKAKFTVGLPVLLIIWIVVIGWIALH